MKKIKIAIFFVCYFLLIVFFYGCGVSYNFNKAKKLEKEGYYPQAIEKYKFVGNRYSKSEYAPYALYNAARIYQKKLKIYNEAAKLYSELIVLYPDKQYWITLAKIGIFNSPDYFPLQEGYSWIEGDSETHGRNMRVERYCKVVSTFPQSENIKEMPVKIGYMYCITKKYYAGKKLVTQTKRYYMKDNYELREMTNPKSNIYTVLLSYPFEKMKSWITVRDKRKIKLTIVATDVSVKTRAGKFDNCLKIKEEDPKLPAAYKYRYYAPGIGHILVTTRSSKRKTEYRNTELISYKF